MTTFMKDGVDIYMPEMDRTAELKMERFAEFMDKFPSISRNIFATSRHQSGATKPECSEWMSTASTYEIEKC
jgi:hypothetical protein